MLDLGLLAGTLLTSVSFRGWDSWDTLRCTTNTDVEPKDWTTAEARIARGGGRRDDSCCVMSFAVVVAQAVQLDIETYPHCGEVGEFAGSANSMIEAMCVYQSRTGLKLVGLHRTLADRLFQPYLKACVRCTGKGLLDVASCDSWEACPSCGGNGFVSTGTLQDWKGIRAKVAREFPDALTPTPTL